MSKPLIGPDRLPVPCQYPGCVWRSTNGSRCANHDRAPARVNDSELPEEGYVE